MYKIVTSDERPMPEQEVIPLKMIVCPKLSGDAIKLVAYLIYEYEHNPNAEFVAQYCYTGCGLTRSLLNKAKAELFRLRILSEYNDPESHKRVYELDYSALSELADIKQHLNVIAAGTSIKSRKYKNDKAAGKVKPSIVQAAMQMTGVGKKKIVK